MEWENIILSKVIQVRRSKIASSHSYVESTPKRNAAVLLDMGHTLRGEHAQEK
jgi:hypothetical protein